MTTPDVLSERLHAVARGVDEVGRLSDVLASHKQLLTDMSLAAATASFQMNSLLDDAKALSKLSDRADETLRVTPRDGQTEVLRGIVASAAEPAARLVTNIEALQQQLAIVAGQSNDLSQLLVDKAAEFVGKIGGRVNTVNQQLMLVRNEMRGAQADKAWDTLWTCVLPLTQQLFADYLDLLGGISILERGMSVSQARIDALCDMSQMLVASEFSKCLTTPVSVLMLPAAAGISGLEVLGLGVGQWSIWGLPIIGHEYGKLAQANSFGLSLSDDPNLSATLVAAFGEESVRVFAADAFAVWAMGPAYAAALLHLELDPRAPSGPVSDLDRACLVSHLLTDDRRGDLLGQQYVDEFVTPLRQAWDATLTEAGTPPIDGVRAELLRQLAYALPSSLYLKQPFSIDDWRISRAIGDALETEAAKPLALATEVGVRHLLNAAWWARQARGIAPDQLEPAVLNLAIANISSLTNKTYGRTHQATPRSDTRPS